MDTKHTPGPWDVSSGAVWGISPWNARVCLANVIDFSKTNGIDSAANARLIANAPDLLEACRGLVLTLEVLAELDGKQCDYVETRHGSLLKVTDVLANARETISKAIGA